MPAEPTLEELYEDAPCGYLSLTSDGVVVRANRTFLRALGRDADAVVGRPFVDLLTAGSRLYAETHWLPKLELNGELREMPVDLVRADGTPAIMLLSAVRVDGPDGTPRGVRASLFDASDRRRYEQELIASRDEERAARQRVERLQRLSAELAGALGIDGVAGALTDGVFDALAPEACVVELDGAVVGERRERFAAPGPHDEHTLPLTVGERMIGVLRIALAGGRALSADEQAFLTSCAASGATALRRATLYAEMQHQALHDPLTGLPNRVLLRERLTHELARARRDGRRFAVAMLGLDGFKLVNDTRGHAAGDEALRQVTARLRGAVRGVDLVARLGGDEFVVVAPDLDPTDEGDALALRLAETFEAPLVLDGAEVFQRASVGVAVADGSCSGDPDALLADADVAMYTAKRVPGAPYLRFEESMRHRAFEWVRVEHDLREALREGHLEVFYQPIVCADDGRLSGLEALVRWRHPERGLVSPAQFVPVAEECGLIVDLGRFVLREATAQLAAWRRAGLVGADVGMTVNVSARQLEGVGLAADVEDALAASGLDAVPHLLGLELTESLVMRSEGSASRRLAELGDLGVRLLLDDFGTGASSLARLRRLPFDTLKIDRAFVMGLGEDDGEDEAIAAAIVALAGALDLDVVAEGVETDAQLARLRHLGARKVQGYLFSPPLPAAALGDLLARADGAGVLPLAA